MEHSRKLRITDLGACLALAIVAVVTVTRSQGDPGDTVSIDGMNEGNPVPGDYSRVSADSSTYALPLPRLANESDVIVIASVAGRGEDVRQPAGEQLISIAVPYTLVVDTYVKGSGPTNLTLNKGVAMQDDLRKSLIVFDAGDPLKVGAPYIFFLDGPNEDGVVAVPAEPFRFRIVDGIIHAESTLSEGPEVGNPDEIRDHPLFPPKSESEFIAEVEAALDSTE